MELHEVMMRSISTVCSSLMLLVAPACLPDLPVSVENTETRIAKVSI
jgi:hypothetical protein